MSDFVPRASLSNGNLNEGHYVHFNNHSFTSLRDDLISQKNDKSIAQVLKLSVYNLSHFCSSEAKKCISLQKKGYICMYIEFIYLKDKTFEKCLFEFTAFYQKFQQVKIFIELKGGSVLNSIVETCAK